MRFGKNVVEFAHQDIPMVGNLSNGYVIGLTQDGFGVCHKMFDADVSEDEINAVDNALLYHLEQGGFFKEESADNLPKTAYFHVTQNCNLDCVGCYSFNEKRNASVDAPYEMIVRALDQLSSCGVKRLIISGGEPFLREDLPTILERAKKLCRFEQIDVLTNGTLVRPDILEQIAPFVDRVSVSIDGCSENSIAYVRKDQRFTELLAAIEMIKEASIRAHLLPTLHAKNYSDIEEYFDLAEQMGVTISFSLLSVPADDLDAQSFVPTEQDLKLISHIVDKTSADGKTAFEGLPLAAKLAVKSYCGAGKGIVSVSHDGQVYPCHMLHLISFLWDHSMMRILTKFSLVMLMKNLLISAPKR